MVSIYKRGSRLYLQYTVNGKRRQKSTGLDDTPVNRKILRERVIPELERRIESGALEDEMRRKEIPKALSHYAGKYLESKEHLKTYWELLQMVKRVEAEFKTDVDKITRGMVRDWAMKLTKSVSTTTARKYVNVLGGILEMAKDYEAIMVNPATGIKLPGKKASTRSRTPFSTDEVATILENATGWFRNYLAIAFYTGARPGEILALKPEDIDMKRRVIRIERNIRHGKVTTTKTEYSVRSVPILDPLLPYLRGQLMQAGEWLFESPKGGHYNGARKAMYHWQNLMERLDIEYRDLYTTRHTFITHMLMSGELSVLELAQIVGHKNAQQIMQSYARFINEQHLKISRKIDPFNNKATYKLADSSL